jgi:hypothetical protein
MNHPSLKLRITTIIALLSFFTLTLTATGAFASPSSGGTRGTHSADSFVQGTDGHGGVFSGVVKITNFVVQGNQLVAQGLLNGTLTKADGTVNSIAGQAVSFAVSGINSLREDAQFAGDKPRGRRTPLLTSPTQRVRNSTPVPRLVMSCLVKYYCLNLA